MPHGSITGLTRVAMARGRAALVPRAPRGHIACSAACRYSRRKAVTMRRSIQSLLAAAVAGLCFPASAEEPAEVTSDETEFATPSPDAPKTVEPAQATIEPTPAPVFAAE